MSFFRYNGIRVELLRTKLFQVDRREDPSGSDHLWNVYRISLVGFLNRESLTAPDQPGGLPPDPALGGRPNPLDRQAMISRVEDSAAFMAMVKAELEVPRRDLLYKIGDEEVLRVDEAPDADLGPKPTPCRVTSVADRIFLVEWGAVVCLSDCVDSAQPDPVVSLRWEQEESFDENWFSRLTTSGRLVVRSDLRQVADSLRHQTVPGVLPDYRRVSSSYTLTPSGTELAFRFVDQEEDRMPPAPATKASGRFVVNVGKGGVVRDGQVDISLEGPKGVHRRLLMARAIAMAYSKLRAEGLPNPPLIRGSFTENLFRPEVSVSLTARLTDLMGGPVAGRAAVDVATATFARLAGLPLPDPLPAGIAPPSVMFSAGQTPGAPEGRAGLPHPVRKRILALVTAAFRDPCLPGGADLLSPDGPLPNRVDGRGVGVAAASLVVADLPVLPAGAAELISADVAPYDSYRVESEYRYSSGLVQLPGTGQPPGPAGEEAAFVTATGPVMTLECSWVAERHGTPPVLPAFFPPAGEANAVPLNAVITPAQVQPGADGANMVYSVSGHYSYGFRRPGQVQVLAPVPPFLADTPALAGVLAARHYSPAVIFSFQGATGLNPFSPQGTDPAAFPDNQLAQAMGAELPVSVAPTEPPRVNRPDQGQG